MADSFFIDARGQLIRRPAAPYIPPSVVDTTIKSFNLTQAEVGAILALPVTDPTRIALLASGTIVSPGLSSAVPAVGYQMAVRASQASYGTLVDQSPAQNVFQVNNGLIPVSFAPSQTVAVGNYRTPSTLNGLIYKVTAITTGTTGGTEPTWPTTLGATVVSGGATFTCEKGPYFVDASGIKLFRSLASTQTGQASVFQLASAAQWDMVNGDSLILNLRIKFDWNASTQGAALPIFSTSTNGTGPGLRVRATGGTLQDLRFEIRASVGGSVLSGNMSIGFPNHPVDGTERNITFMIDGPTRICYCFVDGVALRQADMFDSNSINPNGMNLAALTGSTAGGLPTIGGDPGSALSNECAFKTIDYIVIPKAGLPGDLVSIHQSFSRGGEGFLSQSRVQ